MIKENQKHFNRLHVVIDAFVIIISYFLAWLLKFHLPILRDEGGRLPFHIYMSALLFIVPAYLMLYYAFSLYTPKRVQGRRLEFSNIFKANTLGLFLLITGLYLIKQIDFSRHVIVIFYAINVVSEELTRMLIRVVLRKMRAKMVIIRNIFYWWDTAERVKNILTGFLQILSGDIRFVEF